MSECWNAWANGLPNDGRSPRSGHRMAAEGVQFPWRWGGGTISTNLNGIWGMSAKWSTFYERIWRDCQPRGGGWNVA